jgi:hypothetical protein
MIAPETAAPETVESETEESETVEPETAAPETVESESVEPEAVEPEAVEPETAASELADGEGGTVQPSQLPVAGADTTSEAELHSAETARMLLDIMAMPSGAVQPQERALAGDTLLRLVSRMPVASLSRAVQPAVHHGRAPAAAGQTTDPP